MKKIFNILTVAALVLFAGSCNRNVEFEHETFASFYSAAYTVAETETQLVVPVVLYNPTGSETQIAVSVVDGTAVAGVDYEIVSPANGILNFTGETDSLTVTVGVKGNIGEFTGAKSFKVQLASLTDGTSVGAFNTAAVTILDLDHPLSGFVGSWEGTLMFASNPATPMPTVMTMSIDEEDDTFTKLIVEGFEANYASYAVPVIAIYDAASSKLIIPAGQMSMYVSSSYDFIIAGLDETWDNIINVEYAYDAEAGTLTLLTDYAMLDTLSGSLYSAYYYGTVFTKK